MEIHLNIIGVLLVILTAVHFIFPKYFNWEEELSRVSLINKQIMIIHTFFIALVVFFMGILCLTSSYEICHTPLGKRLALFLGIFWFIRLLIQFFGYSPSLWKGKRLETGVHVLFSLLWTYLAGVFLWVYWM